MWIHCLLPFFRKFKNVYEPVRLLSFLRDEFALWRQLTKYIQKESKLQSCLRNRTNGSSYIVLPQAPQASVVR